MGLDVSMLREVFSQTGANSRVLETDGEDMENRDHGVYFPPPTREGLRDRPRPGP